MEKRAIPIGAVILGMAVVFGAFGAHALKARLGAEALGQWKTAVEYQFYHGLGLLIVPLLHPRIGTQARVRISWFFLLGIVFFSGSLYLLSTRELSGFSGIGAIVGPVTPLGGVLFIAGWLQLAIAAWRGADRG